MTQNERILKYIDDFGSITTLEAVIDLGILRLGARISDLRKSGVIIKDRWIKSKNRYDEKVEYKQYYIEKNI